MHTIHPRLPGELTFIVVATLFSLFLLWASYQISGIAWSSPGSFPMLCAGIMVVTGAMNIVATARRKLALEPGQSVLQQFVARLAPPTLVQFTVLIGVYMLLLEVLGFLLSSYAFLAVSMWLLGSRRLVLNLMVSLLVLAAIFIVFRTAFTVVLPAGSLVGPFTPEFLK
jgi:putative tricarboxylic transport membrane protein